MIIHTADFSASYPDVRKCPVNEIPEYAFIGRSNVGKSSLINSITGRKKLALTSGTPGKTQMLNYFIINKEWYLVDLPGYGYAKLSKSKRLVFRKMIETYLQKRINLQCVFILLDANIEPQKIDIEFINWLGESRIPFAIVYTKIDKSKDPEIEVNIENMQKNLLESWAALPQEFRTSANKNIGQEEILNYIEDINLKYFEWLKKNSNTH